MGKPTVEQMADAMVKMITDAAGKKKYKAGDLQKAMKEIYGDDNVDRNDVKLAIRSIIETGRCVYTYFGGSYIEIPHKEGAAN
jgi:hypothetical protein